MSQASQAETENPPVAQAPFEQLETLWVQITGTLCNLRCSHCFISCSPDNHTLEFMTRRQIAGYIEQAERCGVKELYFTGGEPFLHPEIFEILGGTLQIAPVCVLTNGVLITERFAQRLGELAAATEFSLEIRVSLDAPEEEANDAIRGPGVFRKALRGLQRLQEVGLMPIVTATELIVEDGWMQGGDEPVPANAQASRDGAASQQPRLPRGVDSLTIGPLPRTDSFYERFNRALRNAGIRRPRVKILPVFNMGMLDGRRRAESLTPDMLHDFDFATLQCSASRLVANDGVYTCPILAGEAGARMTTDSLADSLVPCDLYHPACTTCYATGMTCRNY